jgi:hypothetical protein
VRLRPLTEAECYARCYGGRREESVGLVWLVPPADPGRQETALEPYDGSGAAESADGREAA